MTDKLITLIKQEKRADDIDDIYRKGIIKLKKNMEVSVDFTLSPLQQDFEQHIIAFIQKLRQTDFQVKENPLSTQIFGQYDELMPVVQELIKESFEELEHVVLIMKVVKSNRADYEPFF